MSCHRLALACVQYKENESLYFQHVPAVADLAPPAPALLVATVPPPSDLDTIQDKWFAFLQGAHPDCL